MPGYELHPMQCCEATHFKTAMKLWYTAVHMYPQITLLFLKRHQQHLAYLEFLMLLRGQEQIWEFGLPQSMGEIPTSIFHIYVKSLLIFVHILNIRYPQLHSQETAVTHRAWFLENKAITSPRNKTFYGMEK